MWLHARVLAILFLFGACWIEGSHCETTQDNEAYIVLSATQLIENQLDFSSPCNINNFDDIENGGGCVGSFKNHSS